MPEMPRWLRVRIARWLTIALLATVYFSIVANHTTP